LFSWAFFYEPPDPLYEFRLYRLVGVIKIHPDSEPLEVLIHEVHIVCGELEAFSYVALFAELLDMVFAFYAEFFLYLVGGGKAVHVIACPVPDVVSGHPPVSQDAVFEALVPGCAQMHLS
jgi:hypothetical protein